MNARNSRLKESTTDHAELNLPDLDRDTAREMGREIRQSTVLNMSAARSAMVNRTHRVVHQRAKILQAQRSRARSLWIPLLVCSALVLILCTAIWTALAEYSLIPTGIPDSSQQILVLLLWFLPLTGAILAMVWFRRSREQRERADEEQA